MLRSHVQSNQGVGLFARTAVPDWQIFALYPLLRLKSVPVMTGGLHQFLLLVFRQVFVGFFYISEYLLSAPIRIGSCKFGPSLNKSKLKGLIKIGFRGFRIIRSQKGRVCKFDKKTYFLGKYEVLGEVGARMQAHYAKIAKVFGVEYFLV